MKKIVLTLLVVLFICTNLYAYETEYILNKEQITQQELANVLTSKGVGEFSALFTQNYVYEIRMWGPQNEGDSSVTKLLLGQIPQAIIGKLVHEENELTSAGIKIPAGPEFIFPSPNTWHNVTSFCNAEDIIVTLGGDGVTFEYYVGAYLELWIGLDTPLGNELKYEELMDDNTVRFDISAYELVDNHSIPITCNTITEQQREVMFGDDGFTQDYIYRIRIGAYTGRDVNSTFILVHFGQIAVKVMAGSVEGMSRVGADQDNMYLLSEEEGWEDVTAWCNAPDLYTDIGANWITHSGDELYLTMGFNSSLGNAISFEIPVNGWGPESFSIQGYQVSEEYSVPISYNTINKAALDDLLDTDGAAGFAAGFTQNYIYRIRIAAPTGYDGSYVLLHFGQIGAKVIAISTEGTTLFGADFDQLQVIREFNWEDVTAWCNAPDLYANIGNNWITHSGDELKLWIGFNSSIGNSLPYDVLEGYESPATFIIQGYQVGSEITIASRNLAYEPVSQPNIDTLFMNDDADDFMSQFRDYNYLYRFDLYSKLNLTKGNKIKVHLDDTADKVIAFSNGTTRQLATIGKILTQQQLFGVGAWTDVTQYADEQDFYIVMVDDPTEHYPGHLRMWLGSDSWLGQSLTFETVDNATPPDSFFVRSFRRSDKLVENVHVLSPAAGKAVWLQEGDQYYFDRDYYILNIADSLRNMVWIKTANQNKNSAADSLLKISVDRPADVFVGYDHRGTTLPPWLTDNFTQTNYNIDVLDFASPLKVWRQQVPAGMFALGGNMVGEAAGAKSNYIVLVDVEEPLPPVAAFDYEPKQGAVPLTVQFTNQSTGEIDSLRWNFRDGGTSNVQNPVHIFTTVDTFTVSLTVYGPGGVDDATGLVTVQELPPVAAFGADTTVGIIPFTVTFADSSTGVITSWLWQFGDGQSSAEQNPVHVYTTADTFTVSLTVTGPGGSDTETKDNYIITYAPPVAAFTYEEIAEPPFTVNFHDHSTGIITSWMWDFGDGDFSADQNPSHTFALADTFTVILLVQGPGGSSSKAQNIIVTGGQPIAAFEADSTAGVRPFSVQFYDRSSGIIASRSWDFGDGSTSNEQHPVHIYTTADTFSVTLTVTGPGGSDAMTKIDYIIVSEQPPVAAFAANVTFGFRPLTISFIDSSKGIITSRVWDFGDGVQSSDQNPMHTYTTADTFTVTLTVTGPGGTDTETKTNYIIVREQPPVAAFAADSTCGEIPLTVAFADSSAGIISAWLWDFGDGQSSAEQNPVHVYTTVDTFTVSLTVSGPGGSDTETKTDYIIARLPVGIEDKWAGIPANFQLRQNYPNPFNPQTTIVFGLPNTSQVTVIVYNLKGEWIETLCDGKKPAGYHNLVWNAGNRPTGVYFIKMQAGSFVQVTKCVLVK